MGATLTLRRTEGNYLLAFTSLFITIVSGCFWSILKRVLHRCYSTSAPRDTLHHQQQAVFRNSSSAFEGFQTMCTLARSWRHRVNRKRRLFGLLPGSLAAVFVLLAFGIASGFSSQISSAMGTQVRLDGTNCSLVNLQNNDSNYDAYSVQPYRARLVSNNANYAQQCYSSNSSGIFDCTSFVRPRLPSDIDTQASCPFSSGVCRSDNANIHLDTGYIDSHNDLGMNAPESERILFRTVLHCAPLSTDGFSTNLTTKTGNYTIYDYGNKSTGRNYTYKVRSLQDQYGAGTNESPGGNTFALVSVSAHSVNGSTDMLTSSFQPAPGYFRQDGDVYIVFLSGNGVKFGEPVNDIWYRATSPAKPFYNPVESGSREYPAYRPDEAASPMACLQQFQFCDARKSQCGPLGSLEDASFEAGKLFGTTLKAEPTTRDNDRVSRFYWFVSTLCFAVPTFDEGFVQLGANSLASTRSMYSGVMGPLRNDQWQVDVKQWWAAYLAGIQAGVVSTASGSTDPSPQNLLIRPYNKWIQDHICNSQIIHSSDYTSFSLFGLLFTYICGFIIVIVAFSLEPALDYLSDRSHRGAYSYFEWASTETLHLQRMAFQGVKSGTWSYSSTSVPITSQADEIMANLPFQYSIGHDCRETPASNIATEATVGNAVPVSPPEAIITSSESLETQNGPSGHDFTHCH